eukprot:10335913-Karenia_brevis.AAC.1
MVHCHAFQRSVLSTSEVQRMKLVWTFPAATTDLELQLIWTELRRRQLPVDAYFGSVALFSDRDALIVEATGPLAAKRAWPLAEQMIAMTRDKFLILTSADTERWQPELDKGIRDEPEAAIIRIRWKPSKLGG